METAARKKRGKSSPSTKKDAPAASNLPKSPLISDAKLKQLYSTMLHCRLLGERSRDVPAVASKVPPSPGREAAVAGAALDLRRDDWLFPSQNDVLATFVKGMPLASIFADLSQDEPARITNAQRPVVSSLDSGPLPLNIVRNLPNPTAQLNLASGVALAMRARNTGNIVLAFCDDTSSPQSQEALRFAGKHCLPLLVLVHAKASANTASAKKKTAFLSLMSEGGPCELPVIPVDVNDVVAIYRVAYESIHKARHGGGPTLIQAISLPNPPGSTAPSGKHPDAIAKMEAYLTAKGLFSSSWKQKLIDGFNRDLDFAFKSGKKPSLRNRE